jgi:hypothetical protein
MSGDHLALDVQTLHRLGKIDWGASSVALRVAGKAMHVSLDWLPGRGPRAVCPNCDARRRRLYAVGEVLGCYGCLPPWDCAARGDPLSRAVRLRKQLGAEPLPFGELPPRPRYRWAVPLYDRLVAQIAEHENAALAAVRRIEVLPWTSSNGESGSDGEKPWERTSSR